MVYHQKRFISLFLIVILISLPFAVAQEIAIEEPDTPTPILSDPLPDPIEEISDEITIYVD